MSRTPKPVDPKQVERCATVGCTDDEIAYIVGISGSQVRRRFRQELNVGRARLRRCLRRKQIQLAMKGSVPMLIWLGKQYLGQTDRQTITQSERLEIVEEVVFPKEGALDAGQDGQDQQDPGAAYPAAGGVCANPSA